MAPDAGTSGWADAYRGMSTDNIKGLLLALSSSVFIGVSFIVKKKGLKKAGASGTRADMATSSAASNSVVGENANDLSIQNALKRASGDIGWKYGELVDANALDRVKCKLCLKVMSGGIYRLKCHVAGRSGNVKACNKASKEEMQECGEALDGAKRKKKKKLVEEVELRREVTDAMEIDRDMEVTRPRLTIDSFVEINPEKTNSTSFTKQTNLTVLMDKKKVMDTQQYIARWVIESGIPFNAIQNDSFKLMTEAIGQFGPGLPIPSRYRLSSPCLNAEVSRVKNSLKKHEEEWAISGCSIMTDAWTDRKRRSIMNLCVHCKEGISFISSREDSDASHTGSYIFEYVDKCIEDIGPEKVVQVVTDNASNNMAAATLMASKRPNLFWTSCATHTVNLMLEAIGKLPRFKSAIDKARALTIFIYAHHSTLSMMRKLTKKRDIVRPGVTRFASNYLTLQSLVEKKEQLRIMFASEEWARNSHSKSVKGKVAYATVVSISFWKSVNSCLIVFRPLVRVLRIVDSDRPSMPWLYGELELAKREIKEEIYSGVEKNYKPIIDIIETRSKGRLDSDLHLAGYMLNPYYFAKNKVEIGEDLACMEAIINCVEKFFSDDMNIQVQVSDEELLMYKNLVGMFGRKQAELSYQTKGVNDFNPGAGGYSYLYEPLWWAGMITMIVGEVANFAAYAFAPPILVTPLGALSIIISAVLARIILNERLHIFGILGCALCVVGSTTIVLHAPQEREIESVAEVWVLATEPAFMFYAATVIAAVFILIFHFIPQYGQTHIMVYVGVCSLVGSLSVMSVKALGIALKLTFSGMNQLIYPQTWVFTIIVLACVLTQVNYLNKALDTFNTAVVSPIYFVMFTSLTILASVIMFKDWDRQSPTQIVTEMCGFVTILSGTFLLHKTKDMVDCNSPSLSSRLSKHANADGYPFEGVPLKSLESSRST